MPIIKACQALRGTGTKIFARNRAAECTGYLMSYAIQSFVAFFLGGWGGKDMEDEFEDLRVSTL